VELSHILGRSEAFFSKSFEDSPRTSIHGGEFSPLFKKAQRDIRKFLQMDQARPAIKISTRHGIFVTKKTTTPMGFDHGTLLNV
jgi:hypothetical protein